MEKIEWRDVFHRQPAHLVIIDTSSPITSNIIHLISEALKNVICLCFSLKGSPRISSLSVYVISNDTERCIVPLQSLKFNYSRIYSELDNIISVYQELISSEICDDDCLRRLFSKIQFQYQDYCQNVLSGNENVLQLQLSIITAQKGESLAKRIEDITSVMEFSYVRKIQILSVRPSAQEDSPILWPDQSISNVDVTHLDCDPYQLENYFKGWLQDLSTDIEHLRLILRQSSSDNLIVKCDLHQRFINPDVITHGEQHGLSLDAGFIQYVMPNHSGKSSGKVPVYQLEAVATVDASGICESIVYGHPLIVIPTQCWKLDWEELEMNQLMFASLCELLKKDNKVLVASRNSQLRQGRNSTTCSYYLLFPAENHSLLLKQACNREILLSPPLQESEPSSQDCLTKMQECLDFLHNSETYNPVDYQSGLYTVLGDNLKRSKVNKRPKPREMPKPSEFCKASKLLPEGFPTQL